MRSIEMGYHFNCRNARLAKIWLGCGAPLSSVLGLNTLVDLINGPQEGVRNTKRRKITDNMDTEIIENTQIAENSNIAEIGENTNFTEITENINTAGIIENTKIIDNTEIVENTNISGIANNIEIVENTEPTE